MKFSVLATVPLLAFATALPSVIEKRADETSAILAGISTLEKDITTLDGLVTASSVNVLKVQSAEQQVEKDITAIDDKVKSSSTVSSAHSTKVYNEIKNNLKPKIYKVLDDLVAAKSKFASVKSIVKNDLTKLSSLTGTLGKDLTAKASGPAKQNAPGLVAAIQKKFKAAIAEFS